MASGGGDWLAMLSEDILSCEICREEFEVGSRPPRVLPCYHSYCGVCVETLGKEGSVKCPKCRQVAAVADKGFPLDTTRVALLEWKKSVQSQEGVACEGCSAGGKATSKCQDCAQYLCSNCTAAHTVMKVFKTHCVVSLCEAAQSPDKLVQTATEKCQQHEDEKLKLYCLTCAKCVCSICALTMHLKGHEFVELKTVLDDKKKQMVSVCEQLEEAERRFQKKAEESEASLEALECQHRKAASQVQEVFSCVISTAMERQAEVLEELSAKVKCQQLLLEEQLAEFRGLQAASRSAADYGRRLVSVSVGCQVLEQTGHLERTAAELKEKVSTAAAAAAAGGAGGAPFQVGTEKLEEVKALLKSLGTLESQAAGAGAGAGAGVPTGVKDLPIVFPDIRLDARRCHGDCTVSADGCSLINQPHPPSPSQSQQRFPFLGTCGRVALPGQTCYWQVRLTAAPQPEIAEGFDLCECGVSSMKHLQAAGGLIAHGGDGALTVVLLPSEGRVQAEVWHRGEVLSTTALSPFKPRSPVEVTVGFLLDAQRKRLALVDVAGRQVLCERSVNMSQPLWPAVSVVNPASLTRASVRVSVESGEQVTLTPDLVRLLGSVLKGE